MVRKASKVLLINLTLNYWIAMWVSKAQQIDGPQTKALATKFFIHTSQKWFDYGNQCLSTFVKIRSMEKTKKIFMPINIDYIEKTKNQ